MLDRELVATAITHVQDGQAAPALDRKQTDLGLYVFSDGPEGGSLRAGGLPDDNRHSLVSTLSHAGRQRYLAKQIRPEFSS
jgi:hypothetical protein